MCRRFNLSTSKESSSSLFKKYQQPNKSDIVPILIYPDPRLQKKCQPIYASTRKTSESIEEHNLIARQLVATATSHNAYGLAAPQIGHMKRMFTMVKDWEAVEEKGFTTLEDYNVFVDPCIESLCGGPNSVEENVEVCLSIPGKLARVLRPTCIKVSYQNNSTDSTDSSAVGSTDDSTDSSTDSTDSIDPKDDLNNRRMQKKFVGFDATIFQHEFDHLDGVLYLDRINSEDLIVGRVVGTNGTEWPEGMVQ